MLGDAALLTAAGLGPAWAPAVQELLRRAGVPGHPRTAVELRALLVAQTTRATARPERRSGTVETGTQAMAPTGAGEELSCPTRS